MMEDTRQQVLEQFTKTGDSIEPVRELLVELGDDYLLRYHPEQIIWQTEQLLSQPELPYVAIKNHRSQAGTEVFIAVEDQPDLFAAITALLSQNHLNIQAATLFTSPKGLCLDTFIVLDEQGHPLSYEQRIQEIQDNLIDGLGDIKNRGISVSRAVPTRLKYFTVKTRIEFFNHDNSPFTTLEITALDRPALLANIGQAFRDCEIEIHSAKIVTLGERVEDTFTISDRDNRPITDKARIKEIKQHIEEAINA